MCVCVLSLSPHTHTHTHTHTHWACHRMPHAHVNHEDLVRANNGAEAVRNGDARTALAHPDNPRIAILHWGRARTRKPALEMCVCVCVSVCVCLCLCLCLCAKTHAKHTPSHHTHTPVERALDAALCLCIKGGRGLIQENQLWRLEDCTRDGNALLLAARELQASLANNRVITICVALRGVESG